MSLFFGWIPDENIPLFLLDTDELLPLKNKLFENPPRLFPV